MELHLHGKSVFLLQLHKPWGELGEVDNIWEGSKAPHKQPLLAISGNSS